MKMGTEPNMDDLDETWKVEPEEEMDEHYTMNMEKLESLFNGLWWDQSALEDQSYAANNERLECRDFLGLSQQCWEAGLALLAAVLALVYAWPRLRLPKCMTYCHQSDSMVKKLLLCLMCLVLGVQLGIMLTTGHMAWLGSSCHLVSLMQIFLLAAPPSRVVTSVFRLHMYMLVGAPAAVFLPFLNAGSIAQESVVSFVQHTLMLVIPLYLISLGDPYIPEALSNLHWFLTSFGLIFLYHFLPIQVLACVSKTELNTFLYPTDSNLNYARFCRLFAFSHQLLLLPSLGKLLVVLSRALGLFPANQPPDVAAMGDSILKDSRSLPCECLRCSMRTSQEASPTKLQRNSPRFKESNCYATNSYDRCSYSFRDSRVNRSCSQCDCHEPAERCPSHTRGERGDQKLSSHWSKAKEEIPTRHVVNGQLLQSRSKLGGDWVDEKAVSGQRSDQSLSDRRRTNRHHRYSFELSDSMDETLLLSDLEAS